MHTSAATAPDRKPHSGRWKLFLIIAICAAPMMAAYLTYFVIKPLGRTNYGTLIDPRQHPIPALDASTLEGRPASLADYKGKWLLLHVDGGACAEPCQRSLFEMRQFRLMQGKEMDRIERVWLITDSTPLDTLLMRRYEGMRLLRVNAAKLKAWLPVDAGTEASDHLYLVDPVGNLMMRFPKNPDPSRVKKDLSRLLAASSIG